MSQQSTPIDASADVSKTANARLVEFKEAYIAAASQIDKLKEPLLQLVQIRDFLDETLRENRMAEPDWAKFVNEDLCPGIAKRLAKEKSY